MRNGYPQIVSDFLTYMETIRGKSPLTVDEYALDLRMFLRFLKIKRKLVGGDTPFDEIEISEIDVGFVRDVTLSEVYSFMEYLARDRGDKPATRARKVSSLRSFFKYLTQKVHLLETNPVENLDAPKLRGSLPKYLSLEQSLELLSGIEGEFRERDFAIMMLFLSCGLRLSELVGLNLTSISGDRMTVLGKGNKERAVYLSEAASEAIRDYVSVRPVEGVRDKNALFLSKRRQRISNKTVQHLVKKHLAAAGLGEYDFSTHKLRHTAATLMFRDGGVDVRTLQEILGHAQLTTTQIYTHVSDEQMKKASELNPISAVTRKKLDRLKKDTDD